MSALQGASWRAAVVGRWAACIIGTLLFLFLLAFFFGEGPPDLSRLTASERLQGLGIASLFLGLMIAWKWEGVGGLITFTGFVFLAIIDVHNLHRWVLVIPGVIGAVHVLSWWRLRAGAAANLVPWRMARGVLVALIGTLAVFLVLCANEMFGQPPLMTPILQPDSSLLGDWQDRASIPSEFIIHADGTVVGSVGEVPLSGRITYGRSWFGRLLHINSTYRIQGMLSGNRFSMPMDVQGETLDASLFVINRPRHVVLTRHPEERPAMR